MDPIDLRLKNYAEKDPIADPPRPFTSKSLRECYKAGADQFGWARRNSEPRSMKQGVEFIGYGMAGSIYPAQQWASAASVRLLPDLSAVVSFAGADLGTGTYTIMSQIAAESLGIGPEKIRVELGNTDFPHAPVSGGSTQAVTVGSAVRAACEDLVRSIAHFAINDSRSPLHGKDPTQISVVDGNLGLANDPSVREPISAVFSRNGGRAISATAETARARDFAEKWSGYSFGAQFVEVRVNPSFGTVRMVRHVAAVAAGRILNAKTARSQILGGMVMGVGMALHEEGIYDPNRGQIVNNNLADYLVPVNADIHQMDVIFVDEKDAHINALGAKGVGELGITGVAAAIVNAVYHATGKRIRDLPITIEKLMDA